MNDIKRQYSRIYNRLYRQYLDYDISEEQFNRRRERIVKAYDRYERNIARLQGTPHQGRGAANWPGFDNNARYSRSAYAGTNG